VEIKKVREGETDQDEEGSQNINDILPPPEKFTYFLQSIHEVKNKEDQGDQDKREEDKIKKTQIDE